MSWYDRRKQAVKRRASEYFRSRYTETTARSVQGLFNHKCFWNAQFLTWLDRLAGVDTAL